MGDNPAQWATLRRKLKAGIYAAAVGLTIWIVGTALVYVCVRFILHLKGGD